jgi:hypothetical protein
MSGNQQDPDLMCEVFILAGTDLSSRDSAPCRGRPPVLTFPTRAQLRGRLRRHRNVTSKLPNARTRRSPCPTNHQVPAPAAAPEHDLDRSQAPCAACVAAPRRRRRGCSRPRRDPATPACTRIRAGRSRVSDRLWYVAIRDRRVVAPRAIAAVIGKERHAHRPVPTFEPACGSAQTSIYLSAIPRQVGDDRHRVRGTGHRHGPRT